jgi:hypothetical protein
MDAELVVVGTFLNMFDAETAKSALDAAGIASMIRGDDCGGMRPHLWLHGVEVLVRREDAIVAAEILSTESTPDPAE